MGMLNDITQVISSQMSVNIHKILITCEEGIFEGTIEMRVHDRENVRAIMENLKNIQDLKEISEIM
jgi:GTP pyrophosphokinase